MPKRQTPEEIVTDLAIKDGMDVNMALAQLHTPPDWEPRLTLRSEEEDAK
jgi:hypothetical protein